MENSNEVLPTPWLDWMQSHIGEAEQTGSTPTAFDRAIFKHTNFGDLGGRMEPGCAATACAALEETGYLSPHNAGAISFKNYGLACDLKPGCLVVFQWPSGGHHVTFCKELLPGGLVVCLGGNQGHLLKLSTFNQKFIIATRWPIKSAVENHAIDAEPAAPAPAVKPGPNKDHLAWYGAFGATLWTQELKLDVSSSDLPDGEPEGVEDFCPAYHLLSRDQRVNFWMQLISRIAQAESGFDPNSTYQEPGGNAGPGTLSVGLFQISYEDQLPYRLELLDRAAKTLQNPIVNIRCAVQMMNHLVNRDSALFSPGPSWLGLSRYWSTMRPTRPAFAKIKEYCLEFDFAKS